MAGPGTKTSGAGAPESSEHPPSQATGTSIYPRAPRQAPPQSSVTWPRAFVRKPRSAWGAYRTLHPPDAVPTLSLTTSRAGQVLGSPGEAGGAFSPSPWALSGLAPPYRGLQLCKVERGCPGRPCVRRGRKKPPDGSRGRSRGDSGGGARDRRGTYGPEVRPTGAIAPSRPGS